MDKVINFNHLESVNRHPDYWIRKDMLPPYATRRLRQFVKCNTRKQDRKTRVRLIRKYGMDAFLSAKERLYPDYSRRPSLLNIEKLLRYENDTI